MKKLLVMCLLVLSLLSMALSACQSTPLLEQTNTSTLSSTQLYSTPDQNPTSGAEIVSPTETPIPQPSETAAPLSQYRLSALLDYELHQLTVDQHVTFFNPTQETLSELLLIIEPNRYPNGFVLESISKSGDTPITNYTFSGSTLRFPLDPPLPPSGRFDLHLTYQLNLPNQNAPYGYTDRQTNFGDWYPYIPPYRPGKGWIIQEKSGLGEHLAYDPADFEVEIQLARQTDSTGQPLVLAASSLATYTGEKYVYHHSAARNFAWTISPLYQVQEATVENIQVLSYTFPNHPLADGPALVETSKALEVFNSIFSPYPHDSLSVVEADFLDGMEFDGLIFLSHAFYDYYTGDEKSNLTIIAAHEVAHQWWYGLIGNDQAEEPWLDEALSTYSEVLFYEKVYPDLVNWWWENRIFFHDPQGWVDTTIYEPSSFYPYRDAVYLRGALFLRDLRQSMGDQAFFDFLQDYLATFNHQQVTTGEFLSLLEEHAGSDLSGIIHSYFRDQ
jgi:Peptidase family M1 domain